jgi:hypothetical protein
VGGCILTSSGSDQTRSQNAPLWGISWYWQIRERFRMDGWHYYFLWVWPNQVTECPLVRNLLVLTNQGTVKNGWVGGWHSYLLWVWPNQVAECPLVGNLLVLTNQGRVQGWVGDILISSGTDRTRSQNAPLWGISWCWQIRERFRMDGWVGDILTSSGLTKPGYRMPLCGNLLVLMNPRRVQSGWVGFIFFLLILAKVLTEYGTLRLCRESPNSGQSE